MESEGLLLCSFWSVSGPDNDKSSTHPDTFV